ncbi:LysR family transcriptional regulator [Jannaschia donghaensis]|uniref:HTH-type transcriptional regulator YofA n=1 Tax=Jannaschia donghaensis TaxID=420998 RepID=A0A0M6YHG7_9RHOB|nr:LysR family transcriptional regulator [Jannaschia donghaensis]CTQ48707.1 HTH-type transcriptional regulator YofA [Jannaschia donghaensis]
MARNIDTTALRAFATVAATGGVTRAAALLHLTQSAVSMQVKRLEEALDARLLDRTGRGVTLTAEGEQVLAYARRMLTLNDELLDRMRDSGPAGEIRLGVPHDIVPRCIPAILRAFAADYPRVRLTLISSVTSKLKAEFAQGGCDVILTTETVPGPGGEEVVRLPLIWVGAEGGTMWQQRPLRLAFNEDCVFRTMAQDALNAADIPWDMAMTADSSRAVDATVSADLACHVVIDGFDTLEMAPIAHGGTLPDVGEQGIAMYVLPGPADAARDRLLEIIRDTYGALAARPSRPVLVSG